MSKILAIPKHKILCGEGVTKTVWFDIWSSYGKDMLYLDLSQDFKLFYKIIPYLIIEHEGRYLVYEGDGSYCFNLAGLVYIREGMGHDPIRTIINHNADKYVKTHTGISALGFIRSTNSHPNDLAVVYIMKLKKQKKPRNCVWLTLDELINKCRMFDSFGIEFIDYLVRKKVKTN